MCERCEEDVAELDDDNFSEVLIELTDAAVTSAALLSRGWTGAATGLLTDVITGSRTELAKARLTWTWATMCNFLPPAEGWLGEVDSATLRERMSLCGVEPSEENLTRSVHLADQILTMIKEAKAIVSRQDLDAFTTFYEGVKRRDETESLVSLLLGEAAARYGQARHDENSDLDRLKQHLARRPAPPVETLG